MSGFHIPIRVLQNFFFITIPRLHNEELHNMYSSPSIIRMIKSRRMRWARHVAHMEAQRIAYRILVGKPKRKRPLGSPRRCCVGNIMMNLTEKG
jgi:hypothetical protein